MSEELQENISTIKKGSVVSTAKISHAKNISTQLTKTGKVVQGIKKIVAVEILPKKSDGKTFFKNITPTIIALFIGITTLVFLPAKIKERVENKVDESMQDSYLDRIQSDLVKDDSLKLNRFLKQQLEYVIKVKQDTAGKSIPEKIIQRKIISKSQEALGEEVKNIILKITKKRFDVDNLANSIVKEALEQKYDPIFTAAVIRSESAFNEMAKSWVGARGLMQIMPATGEYLAKRFAVSHSTDRLHERNYNLKLGISYLKELEDKYVGNRLLTLIAYNWGPAKLDKAIKNGRGVPAECIRYALKIMQDHNLWENGYVGKI